MAGCEILTRPQLQGLEPVIWREVSAIWVLVSAARRTQGNDGGLLQGFLLIGTRSPGACSNCVAVRNCKLTQWKQSTEVGECVVLLAIELSRHSLPASAKMPALKRHL